MCTLDVFFLKKLTHMDGLKVKYYWLKKAFIAVKKQIGSPLTVREAQTLLFLGASPKNYTFSRSLKKKRNRTDSSNSQKLFDTWKQKKLKRGRGAH